MNLSTILSHVLNNNTQGCLIWHALYPRRHWSLCSRNKKKNTLWHIWYWLAQTEPSFISHNMLAAVLFMPRQSLFVLPVQCCSLVSIAHLQSAFTRQPEPTHTHRERETVQTNRSCFTLMKTEMMNASASVHSCLCNSLFYYLQYIIILCCIFYQYYLGVGVNSLIFFFVCFWIDLK